MTATATTASAWKEEYARQGIPSSHRDEPSGVLLWALANVDFVGRRGRSAALDVGCGTGRNALALAKAGYSVTAMDFSSTALDIARNRPGTGRVDFLHRDVTDPLPASNASCDLVTDIFVYFHQLDDETRRRYREEVRRVLTPTGVLLLSLATDDDGYYGQCPRLDNSEYPSSVPLTWDPHAAVGNVLLSREQLFEELSDCFTLSMSWQKRKTGLMHGKSYVRHTLAGLWTPRY